MTVHFLSQTDEWSTPPALFDALDKVFHFDVDVCATPENAKCQNFYTRDQDGLAQPWTGTVWCNPPYGRQIGKWVKKAYESDAGVVMLLPARTDTSWWQAYCTRGEITFLKGRLKFGDSKNGAPFPSAIVTFRLPKRYIRECISCRGIFAASRSDACTCSGACRVAMHRQRAA